MDFLFNDICYSSSSFSNLVIALTFWITWHAVLTVITLISHCLYEFDQSMQMEVFAWIFYKINGVLYMMLRLFWHLSRWYFVWLFFLLNCSWEIDLIELDCFHFVEFHTINFGHWKLACNVLFCCLKIKRTEKWTSYTGFNIPYC